MRCAYTSAGLSKSGLVIVYQLTQAERFCDLSERSLRPRPLSHP